MTLKVNQIIQQYEQHSKTQKIVSQLKKKSPQHLFIKNINGSARPLLFSAIYNQLSTTHVIILQDKEKAAYFHNDLQNFLEEKEVEKTAKKLFYFPASYKKSYTKEDVENINILLRAEVMKNIYNDQKKLVIVTYPEAIAEQVVEETFLKDNSLTVKVEDELSVDFLTDFLLEFDFKRVEFVTEPGDFSMRGGIVDLFSYDHDMPFRIEFFGDAIESIRTFNPVDQLSVKTVEQLTIIPNIQEQSEQQEQKTTFIRAIGEDLMLWFDDLSLIKQQIDQKFNDAEEQFKKITDETTKVSPDLMFSTAAIFEKEIKNHHQIEWAINDFAKTNLEISWKTQPQPPFKKNFSLLKDYLIDQKITGKDNFIFSNSQKQLQRLQTIFHDLETGNEHQLESNTLFTGVGVAIYEGFIDEELNITCFTDHQIFERFHRFRLKKGYNDKEALTLKEFFNLQPGDFVTHIDYGIGRFDGLEILENNGRKQESIRLVYANGDLLYVNINSLHRIAKYTGKEGVKPTLHRLGSNTWNNLKKKTKKKVKDIAKDLIKLYAERKVKKGFAYAADTYLQDELESSFIYEDTPDQSKATIDTKADMEKPFPMDRLICGDVGFGKTEIAIRAAFKAVSDNKQVAVLVPTTILALQHYRTFSERLSDFPCEIAYINRFKTTKQIKETLKKLAEGKIDILIGTHRLVSKDVKFKDLGLLIIDEEQKFGVATKEKIRQFKSNVDTLTLTATPIPRTLQFSLMGARDLSIINTPPPNRHPVKTTVIPFSEEAIRDAIQAEISRGGQVYFVHNRVKNIEEVSHLIKKALPTIRIAVGHGQMEGKQIEKIMLDFIEGEYDVLLSTTIIESGLDISNANTIIINEAHNFGLSDLHQLRGRVGRSNKKAFCYLITPPLATLTNVAQKRLRALEQFNELGSGFNIAMRDLDIRGAGNILGAEQSGFITDIGYEIYQKILNEALTELKTEEFSDLYEDNADSKAIDCQIETDFELRFPTEYISNTTERLSLYKELDGLKTETELKDFENRLKDRFGNLPQSALHLIDGIRLRSYAGKLGFSRIVIKSEKMVCHFLEKGNSNYFDSKSFKSIMEYVKINSHISQIKPKHNTYILVFSPIKNMNEATAIFKEIYEM